MKKLGRNDPCRCGSGLKYKKCCLDQDNAPHPLSLEDIINNELTWPNELHRLIAHHFLQNTSGLYEEGHIAPLILAWNMFALEKSPVSKKLGGYPSALEYLLCQSLEYETTQSELAKKYNVSVATLSQRTHQLYEFLEEHSELPGQPPVLQHSGLGSTSSQMKMEQEMTRLHALLDQHSFDSIEEINTFLEQNLNSKPSRSKPASKEERASEILYEAWNEPDLQRKIKLAQEALLLDPSSGDAYSILAECSLSPKEKAYFYKKGMLVEEKRLGETFFKENKGHFWGQLPTRPFMRAKKGYADTCAMLDKMPEAIQHYRELLELNPTDNQGVRDFLLSSFIEEEEWKAAKQLIQQYDNDGCASFNYGRVLVEYGLNGNTSHLTFLMKQATAHNKFVPAYLQGKKKLPHSMPEYMGYGDEKEAIVYASMNRHLWLARPELLLLLPVRKK